MPEEILALNIEDRILAHINDGYNLPDEDKPYLDTINMAFKLIHGEEDRDTIPKKLKTIFGHLKSKEIQKLIDDVTYVYGDFFLINRTVMRIIQERRHERVYEAAFQSGDYPASERALKSIDELNNLYSTRDTIPNSVRKMPRVKRTTDPAALKIITGTDNE